MQAIDLKNKKARQILRGAKSAFLDLGYEGASTDEIVRRAGVSKGTLYNYFPDKKTLFAAFVHGECEEQARRIFTIDPRADDIEIALRHIAKNYCALMVSPFMQGILRIVVAEAERFPDLAHIFYESGPLLGHERLSALLKEAVEDGVLAIGDIELAAHQFIQLGRSDLFFKRLFCIQRTFTDAEISRIANSAVDAFLKMYGTPRHP